MLARRLSWLEHLRGMPAKNDIRSRWVPRAPLRSLGTPGTPDLERVSCCAPARSAPGLPTGVPSHPHHPTTGTRLPGRVYPYTVPGSALLYSLHLPQLPWASTERAVTSEAPCSKEHQSAQGGSRVS